MVLAGCAAAWIMCTQPQQQVAAAPEKASFAIDQARMRRSIDAVKRGPEWHATRIEGIDANRVSATILYKSDVGGIQAKMDATALVRTILQEIVKEGGHPADDWSFINVAAQQDGLRGETGVSMVRPYGSAYYDFNADQIVYKSN